MDAKRCDRCGEYYVDTILADYRVQFRDNKNGGWHTSNVSTMDLCYECRLDLEQWINAKKIQKPAKNEEMVNVEKSWVDGHDPYKDDPSHPFADSVLMGD